jgi:NitT/TauT family transport system substrate-binding protein
MHCTTRRDFLKDAAGSGLALGLMASGLSLPSKAMAQANVFKWANLAPGFTILLSEYMIAKGYDKQFGLNLSKPTSYTAVTTYYNDFIAGNFDICIGSWDTFAARYLAGVPIQFVSGITTASMIGIVVPGNGVKNVKELEGKMLAAPQSTGTYRMARAVIKELEGFDIETQAKVQNVDNPAASVSLVMAKRADAALTWEPNISAGLTRVPDMRVLYNVGDAYRAKMDNELPYFGVAIRKDAIARDKDLARKVDQAFGAAIAGILADPDAAVKLAGEKSGIPADVLAMAIKSKRLQFEHLSMSSEAARKSMLVAGEFLRRNALLPRALDDGFFGY